MSWASVYWDLEHIIQAARLAMEAAIDESAGPGQPGSAPATATLEDVEIRRSVNADGTTAANAEVTISISVEPAAAGMAAPQEIDLAVSLTRSSITAKPIVDEPAVVQPRSLWTPEIEAALREFLRPLSANLQYEYRLPDTLDEKRSIAALNSLFRLRPKASDTEARDDPTRNELQRRRYNELRRSAAHHRTARKTSPAN